MKLYEVLYVSTIAPDAPVSVVANIARTARAFYAAHDMTGLLIFDGQRFCQQLEGSQKDVLALMERIQKDTRHVNVEVVHHGLLALRRFRDFAMGFTLLDDVDLLGPLEKMDGEAALNSFTAMLPTLDIFS